MNLFDLLETVLVIGILFGIVMALVKYVQMPDIFKIIAYGILAIICVVLVFNLLRTGDIGGLGGLRIGPR
jgi:hypothetical protein